MQNQFGRWCIDFLDENSKRRRKVVGDGNSFEAAKIEARRMKRVLVDKLTTERNPETASVDTVLSGYFDGNTAFDTIGLLNKVSTLTRMRYHAIYRHFKEFFPARAKCFRDLKSVDVEAYLKHRRDSGAKEKTILNEFQVLRTLCRWASQERQSEGKHFFLPYDITVAEGIKRPKPAEKLPSYYSVVELEKLFASARADKQLRAIVALGYYHGLRTSSVARLRTQDVDLIAGSFKVWKKAGGEWSYDNPNNSIEFTLHADALEALRDCAPSVGSDFYFGAEWALTPGLLSQYLCAWIRKTLGSAPCGRGEQLFHRFRHTYCHELFKQNTPMPIVQRAMGHGQLSTTAKYAKVWDHEVKDVGLRLPTVAVG
jgi:site-specific recombinase XerD